MNLEGNISSALLDSGIPEPHPTRRGTTRALCPKCSSSRRGAHRLEPCLSITIDDEGFAALCHHCGWRAGYRDSGYRNERPVTTSLPIQPLATPGGVDVGSEELTAYMTSRGISEKTWLAADISLQRISLGGSAAKAIAFPYRKNPGGPVVNVKYRTRDKRFSQIKGGEQVFYGLDMLDSSLDSVVIVEGEMDRLSMIEAGIPNCLSVPGGAPQKVSKGGTVDPSEDKKFGFVWAAAEELADFRRVIMAVDGDTPGQALQEELSRRFGRERCWKVVWPEGCKDANDVLVRHGPAHLAAAVQAAEPYPIKALYQPSAYKEEVVSLFRDGRERGLRIGYSRLDELFTVRPGELTVVTGIPNAGKSDFIDQVVVNMVTAHSWSFGLCSFENPPAEHISKLLEKHFQMPFWDGPNTRMDERHISDGLQWLEDYVHFIRADDEAPTIDWILEAARAAVMRYGIRGLVIDPYNEIEHHRGGLTETEYVSQMLSKVKRFAQAHAVHVFFVAHPHKLYRDKDGMVPVPTAYDISGGANWANKADNIMVVSRNYESGDTDIYLRKVRWKQTGKPGCVTLGYDPITGCYYQDYLSEPLSGDVEKVRPEIGQAPF